MFKDYAKIASAKSEWTPENRAWVLALVGKLGEESSELAKVCFRIIIQGLDGIDPKTKVANLVSLKEELADVKALSKLADELLDLVQEEYEERVWAKFTHKKGWIESLVPTSIEVKGTSDTSKQLVPHKISSKRANVRVDGGALQMVLNIVRKNADRFDLPSMRAAVDELEKTAVKDDV